MKKMMIAAAIVCAAAMAQAVTVNWGLTGNLDDTQFATGTAYLICVDNLAKPAAFADDAAATAWYDANKGSLASSAFRTASVADGALSESESISEAIGKKNYWLVIVGSEIDNKVYLAVSTSTKSINITTGSMSVNAKWIAGSQMQTNAVPEPTSGLLMLVGLAGLALRRRRA